MDVTDPQAGPSPSEHRMMLATELQTCADLLDYLDVAGCQEVRRRLHHPDTLATGMGTQIMALRAVLLDRTCRRLVDLEAGALDYYAGIGDVFGDAPDDASSIDGLSV